MGNVLHVELLGFIINNNGLVVGLLRFTVNNNGLNAGFWDSWVVAASLKVFARSAASSAL